MAMEFEKKPKGNTQCRSFRALLTRNYFFFVFLVLGWLNSAILRSLGLSFFHRLLGFRRLLGASFSTFLPLLVKHLFAAEEFEECLVGAISLVPRGANDARVAAITIAESRSDGIEQLHHGFVGHQIPGSQATSREISALAQGDHFFDQRTRRLGLGNGRLDALLNDHRSDQVAQQRTPVRRVPSEFVACNFVTHGSTPI